ncbi:hypothetical protein CDAR_18431 [Caerostris darwini]|uniref:Ribosomal protein L2 n=1 Tax=Caerostris darwini TaxID=1538125 RepID=A0AAV4VA79_9ARAC|nr:hypothetical protein CDAR_18431 [Caerostris darwini]
MKLKTSFKSWGSRSGSIWERREGGKMKQKFRGERVLAVYNRSAGNIHRMHGVLLVKTSPGNRPMINLGGWPSGVGGEAIAIHHPADDGPPVR